MKTQPKGIELQKWYDQTQLVRSSIAALEEAIGIGLVFAGIVDSRLPAQLACRTDGNAGGAAIDF